MARQERRRHLSHDTLSTKGEFDDLLVVEILTDPQGTPTTFQTDERGKFVAWIKKNLVPYFPASSCQRHVYLLKKSDVEKYFALMEADVKYKFTPQDKAARRILLGLENHHNLTTHSAEAAMTYLTKWIAGGLNRQKYLQDTYNVKTVTIGFECFKTLSLPGGSDSLAARKLAIEGEVAKITDPKSERASWLKEEKEEIDRVVKFFNPKALQKNGDFVTYLGRVFEVAIKLSSVLHSLKELPTMKALWSADITKLTLSIAEKKDVTFFQRVIECRTEFIDTAVAALTTYSTELVAKEDLRSATMKHLRNLEERISDLARKAKDKKDVYPAGGASAKGAASAIATQETTTASGTIATTKTTNQEK